MTALPTLRGRDLTGRPRALPDDLHGAPAVLLLGFAVRHQRAIDLWLAAFGACAVPAAVVLDAGGGVTSVHPGAPTAAAIADVRGRTAPEGTPTTPR